MAGAADALQERCDRARRAELADEVNLADVDAELERGGRDQRLQGAGLEALLGVETQLFGKAAVMRRHLIRADALREMAGHPLDQPAGVDKDQGRPVLADQIGEAVVNLLPDIARHDCFERRGWNLDREIAGAAVAGVDDRALVAAGADKKPRHGFDRLLRRRQTDPQQPALGQRRQPLERHGEMAAALVRCHRMDFVDDDGPGRRQHRPAGLRAEQDVKRFRGGDDDVRRPAVHLLALALGCVAGAHPAADRDVRQALLLQRLADPGERRFEVAADVVRQRLQRRDVDHLGLVAKLARQPLPHQHVDRSQKSGERLARAGRRRDQHMPAGLDRRPSLRLRRRRRRKAALEPSGNGGMK